MTFVVTSTASHVGRLGFSNDDWEFLDTMSRQQDRSFLNLYATMQRVHELASRPLQTALDVTLFKAFGEHPLGYHVFNTVVLACACALLYLLLHELRVPRWMAFAVPAIYIVLPSWTTSRLWFAAFDYNLVMLALFAGVYADLRAVRGGHALRWRWKLTALAAFVAAGLGHEVALPLIGLGLIAVALHVLTLGPDHPPTTRAFAVRALVLNIAVLVGIVIFKAMTAQGVTAQPDLRRLAAASVGVHLGTFGLGLPQAVWWGLRESPAAGLTIVALLTAGLGVYLRAGTMHGQELRLKPGLWLLAAGVVVLGASYTVFLTTDRYDPTATGIGNRVATAGALGAALILVGAAGCCASVFRSRATRRTAASVLVGVLVGAAATVTLGISSRWVEASESQVQIVDSIHRDVGDIEAGTVMLLAGVCPYEGPAVVFDSDWDLAGALSLRYDKRVEADVITPRATVDGNELVTTTYGAQRRYPFGEHTLVYWYADDHSARSTTPLTAEVAQDAMDSASRCPLGREGWGEPLLPIDRWMFRRTGPL